MDDTGATWFDDEEERAMRETEEQEGWRQQQPQQQTDPSRGVQAQAAAEPPWTDSFPPDDPSQQLLPHDSLSHGMVVTQSRMSVPTGRAAAAAGGWAPSAGAAAAGPQQQQQQWSSASAFPATSNYSPKWNADQLLAQEEQHAFQQEAEEAQWADGGGSWADSVSGAYDEQSQQPGWGTLPRFPAAQPTPRGRGRGRGRANYGSSRGGAAAPAAGQQGWSSSGSEPGSGRGRGRGRGRFNNHSSRGGHGHSGIAGSGSGISAHSDEPSVAAYQMTFGTQDMIEREMGEDLEFNEDDDMQANYDPAAAAAAGASASSSSAPSRSNLPLTVLPEPFRAIFPYPHFNRVQSKSFDAAFHSDDNLVVAAPTGSGKTVVFELALLRYFNSDLLQAGKDQLKANRARAVQEQQEQLDAIDDGGEVDMTTDAAAAAAAASGIGLMEKKKWQHRKAVYIAPLKALCDERFRDWTRFQLHLGLSIVVVTGDKDANWWAMARANIIITTPEKWDAMSRRTDDKDRQLVSSIGLMLVDEIHLLHENPRGAVLEGLMSRYLLRQQAVAQDQPVQHLRAPIGNLRVIGLSATAPNAADVAEWLRGRVFEFSDEHRPVPLRFHVYDYKSAPNNFIFESGLNKRLMELIRRHSQSRPTLVFVSTRKATVQAATAIVNDAKRMGFMNELVRDPGQRERLEAAAVSMPVELQELVRCGVAPHHGGLDYSARGIVEQLFIRSDLRVVCSTSTLGQGVNLPAYLVIVRGTTQWVDRAEKELDSSTLTQMIGRAGRPQYDKEGVAVVMTSSNKLHQYSSILRGVTIESHLYERMIEHLNAEIVGNGSATEASCMKWLKLTFMFTRMKKDPIKYFRRTLDQAQIEGELHQRLLNCLNELIQANMLERADDDVSYRPTGLGGLMARWYLSFQTVRLFNSINDQYTFEDFLDTFAKSHEWTGLRINIGDKGVLNPFVRKRKKPSAAAAAIASVSSSSASSSLLGEEGGESTEERLRPIGTESSEDAIWNDPYYLPYEVIGNRVLTVADKIKVLVQLKCLGREEMLKGNFTLKQELQQVTTGPGSRVARAMADYMVQRVEHDMRNRGPDEPHDPPGHVRSGWLGIKNAVVFKKCLENGTLDRSPQIFAQLPQVGPTISAKLFAHAKTFDALTSLLDQGPSIELQQAAGRKAAFFDKLLKDIYRTVPIYRCNVEQLGVLVELRSARLMVEFGGEHALHRPNTHVVHLIAGTTNDRLLYYRRATVSDLPIHIELEVKQGTQVMAFMIDDTIVGCDVKTHTYMRYDNIDRTPSFSDWEKCLKRLEQTFTLKEIKKRSQHEIAAAELKAEAQAAADDELASFDRAGGDRMKRGAGRAALDEDGPEPPPVKPPCKHKAKACVEGRCKHGCCKERAQEGGVPLFDTSASASKQDAAPAPIPRSLLFGSAAAQTEVKPESKDDAESLAASASSSQKAAGQRRKSVNECFSAELMELQSAAGGEGSSSLVGSKRVRMQAPPSSLADPSAYYEREATLDWNRQDAVMKAHQRAARQQEQQQQQQAQMQMEYGASAAAQAHGGWYGGPAAAASPHPSARPGMMWTSSQPAQLPGSGAASAAMSAGSASATPAPAAISSGSYWESLLDPEERDDLAWQRARQQRQQRRPSGAVFKHFQ